MRHLLDIVIVNWNAGSQLRECVESVLTYSDGEVTRVIVVDNASSDRSADAIEGLSRVNVIHSGENLGFGAACNVGASRGSSPYVLFLNPDTQVETDSVLVPLAFMERPENSAIGICGIQLIDERGMVSRSCSRFPSMMRLASSALGLDKVPGVVAGVKPRLFAATYFRI